jgi:hypothetical protein
VLAHPRLRQLSFHACDLPRLRICCPALEALSATGTVVASLLSLELPALRRLDLSGCHGLAHGALRSALAGLTALEAAALCGGAGASDDALRAAAGGLPALRELVLTGCGAAVTLNGVTVRGRRCLGLRTPPPPAATTVCKSCGVETCSSPPPKLDTRALPPFKSPHRHHSRAPRASPRWSASSCATATPSTRRASRRRWRAARG